jgi:iron complex transport system permease protein
MKSMQRLPSAYILVSLSFGISLILSIAVGAVDIPIQEIGASFFLPRDGNVSTYATILQDIRLPHTILIVLAGAALGASGAAYQGLFRNPLADPYLIGVASGAGLGAVAAMALPLPVDLWSKFGIPGAAFIGAIGTVGLVYFIARSHESTATTGLILAGVAVGSFSTALTTFLLLRSEGELRSTLAWLIGGSTSSGWDPVFAALPYIAIGLAIQFYYAHSLNTLQFGDEQATQLGIDVPKVKMGLVIGASLATAAAVSFAGIIGFVGLIIPHMVRFLWGSDHRHLIPLSMVFGASFLLLSDIIARRLLAPQTLPVGIITALFGAPFFLWILRRYRHQGMW